MICFTVFFFQCFIPGVCFCSVSIACPLRTARICVWLVGSVQQCRALLSACFFFSPNAVISGFDHSFQIQAPRVKYLGAAAHRTWCREKKARTENQALFVTEGILLYFLPDAVPSSTPGTCTGTD